MFNTLFARHDDSDAIVRSPDTASGTPAAAAEYATLGPMAIPQAGPAATRLVSAPSTLSPVVRAAAERISSSPVV